MPIDPSLEQGAFGPEATGAMGEAFEAACKELRESRPASNGAQSRSPPNYCSGAQR